MKETRLPHGGQILTTKRGIYKVAARMEQMGGQMADWNFELRGAQSWIADENRWNYNEVKVHLPNGDYEFKL